MNLCFFLQSSFVLWLWIYQFSIQTKEYNSVSIMPAVHRCKCTCVYVKHTVCTWNSVRELKHIWIIFCSCSVLYVVACSNAFLIQQWAIIYSVLPLRAVFNSLNTYEPIHPPQSHHASACSPRAQGAGFIGVSNASPSPRSIPTVLKSSSNIRQLQTTDLLFSLLIMDSAL